MYEVFLEALVDTAKMIPLLLIIYVGIEYIEYKFGSKIRDKVKHAGKAGPALGAAFGSVPQCGFSVISTALYTKRLVSMGTLLAVYLSTSDEALPVILAQPHKVGVIFPLLAAKIIIAIVAGYTIDFIFHRAGRTVTESEICVAADSHCDDSASGHGHHDTEKNHSHDSSGDCHDDSHEELMPLIDEGCCGHNCAMEKPNYREMVRHPIIHTLKVFVFIFGVTLALNLVIFFIGEDRMAGFLLGHTVLQPIIVSLVGLIPNCAASVAITQVFLQGAISFGSAVAGLSASAGLGLLVLLKENKDRRDTLTVVGLLYGISVLAGIVIQYLYG